MSAAHATTVSTASVRERPLVKPATLLAIGVGGVALTALGLVMDTKENVAFAWLIAFCFWLAITLGALLMVMIHHIFDAGWSTVPRRVFEHWTAAFVPLGVVFLPLALVATYIEPGLVWKWLDVHSPAIANDVLWVKKSAFLNPHLFFGAVIFFFGLWIWLSARLRKHSFAQDEDGDPKHTLANRVTAAFGIPVTALSLTFGAFYWLMSLEYHWFSTMYGVWYFASCMRAFLAFSVLLCIYLSSRGVLHGLFKPAHLLNFGNLMLAFTIFWAYVTFSQYFLIWNANIPEETFWYNLREWNPSTGEFNSWRWVGMVLVFGHFVFPFLFFLQYPLKKKAGTMIFISVWVLVTQLVDFIYNIQPAHKLASGDPVRFGISPWFVTAFLGIGGLCLWAFFRSFQTTRAIPIRDPRIAESLNLHE